MKKIMVIGHYFRNDEDFLIIGGTNPDFDNLRYDDFSKIVTPFIYVKSKNKSQRKFRVLDFKFLNTARDKKNIFILLPKETKDTDVEIGSIVYTVENLETGGRSPFIFP